MTDRTPDISKEAATNLAALQVFRKHKPDDGVMYVDASREFIFGTNQNVLDETHIDTIVATYAGRQSVDKYAYRVARAEVVENDFNLNIPRCVDTFEEEDQIDLLAVRAERVKLKDDLAALEKQMSGYLQEPGYGS